jgi:hypothetical protein
MRLLQTNIGDLANGSSLNVAMISAVAVFAIVMLYKYFRCSG